MHRLAHAALAGFSALPGFFRFKTPILTAKETFRRPSPSPARGYKLPALAWRCQRAAQSGGAPKQMPQWKLDVVPVLNRLRDVSLETVQWKPNEQEQAAIDKVWSFVGVEIGEYGSSENPWKGVEQGRREGVRQRLHKVFIDGAAFRRGGHAAREAFTREYLLNLDIPTDAPEGTDRADTTNDAVQEGYDLSRKNQEHAAHIANVKWRNVFAARRREGRSGALATPRHHDNSPEDHKADLSANLHEYVENGGDLDAIRQQITDEESVDAWDAFLAEYRTGDGTAAEAQAGEAATPGVAPPPPQPVAGAAEAPRDTRWDLMFARLPDIDRLTIQRIRDEASTAGHEVPSPGDLLKYALHHNINAAADYSAVDSAVAMLNDPALTSPAPAPVAEDAVSPPVPPANEDTESVGYVTTYVSGSRSGRSDRSYESNETRSSARIIREEIRRSEESRSMSRAVRQLESDVHNGLVKLDQIPGKFKQAGRAIRKPFKKLGKKMGIKK